MRRVPPLAAIVLLLIGLGPGVQAQQADARRYVPGELLVAFEPWISDAGRADVRRTIGGALKRALRDAPDGRLELVTVPPGLSIDVARRTLARVAGVRYAELNWIYAHAAMSNDPGYTAGYLWGMQGDASTPANAFGSQAAEVWTAGATGSSAIHVAVIDEGIDFNHPDLAPNIWVNPFDAPDGVDNDGNGYVDDVRGWDFDGNDNTVFDGGAGSTADQHGTHVAGTIGAAGGNGAGVVGVNWNVTIIPAKFLGADGGTTAGAVAALDYVTDLKRRHGLNIVATNNSWGGGGFSQALLDAITRGAKEGILFVAAAGNGNLFGVGLNNDSTPNYPSNYDTTQGTATESGAPYDAVIAVASITSAGARSSFSNYGQTTVDLGAPGSGIWSTTPNDTYSTFSGTSMATPHVTGAAALFASMNPGAAASAIKTAILDSAVATPTASMSNRTVTNGRLNVSQFVGAVAGPPAAPTNLTVVLGPGAQQATLSWTDGSGNETAFRIFRCGPNTCTSASQIVQAGEVGTNVRSFVDTVSPSGTYSWAVRAVNASGVSEWSNAVTTVVP